MEPDDLLHLAVQAAQMLTERHAARLRANESITLVFGHHQGARRLELRLHDLPADRLMEFILDVPDLPDDRAISLGLDFLDGALAQHLQGEREAIPRLDPAPCSFEGHKLYLHGGLRRPDLEAQADALLAAHPCADSPQDPEDG